MGKKFNAIYEAVVSRYNVGGFLPGDIVKFRSNYKSTPTYKSMHSQMQKELDELVNSGLNIKVVQVGSKNYNMSAANDHKTADNVVITVAGDHGGGRYYGSITVSADMIDMEDAGNPTPKIPDQFYKKDNTNWKPEEWKADQQNITRVTDKGGTGKPKNTPTNIKLAGESTRLKRDNNNIGTLYESIYKPEKKNTIIDDRIRQAITSTFTKKGLDGNARFQTVGQALVSAQDALDSLGFELDMVSNDIEVSQAHHHPGMKKQMLIPFRRKSTSGDPFDQEPEIENSAISFNFENLGRSDDGANIEVVAYAS